MTIEQADFTGGEELADDGAAHETLKRKILHVLEIYSVLNYSMLQMGMGTNCKPAVWRPVLQELINEGRVVVRNDPHKNHLGQTRYYEKITLAQQVI